MRRPLKPFVTEYRGGARRQTNTQGPSLKLDRADLDADLSGSPAPEPWPPRPAPSALPQEDSYEAALRAADALFAARARKPDPSEPGKAHPAEAASAADDAASGQTTTSPQPHPAGGRILRAIEEAPSQELLRLEAEFAPKRRGRKPGSKNKPKMEAPVVAEGVAAVATFASSEPLQQARPLPMAAPRARLTPVAAATAGPKGDRYAWVRTKLKPGQQWKRRIPKVAW